MSAASDPREPAVPGGFRLSTMLRASIFVQDLDESLKLYRDILGNCKAVKNAGYTVIAEPMVLIPAENPSEESLEMIFFRSRRRGCQPDSAAPSGGQ